MEMIICVGLPGSGKSTWANAQKGYVVVNRDSLRLAQWGNTKPGSKEQEKLIKLQRNQLLNAALRDGKSVISDDTNLSERTRNELIEIARKHGASVTIQDFRHVPVVECILRDEVREKRVGAAVIMDMAKQFGLITKPELVGYPEVFLCDLDGTVALMNGRSPYDCEACESDLPNAPIVELVNMLVSAGKMPIFVSGREEKCREQTENWLKSQFLFEFKLFMRATGDNRRDSIVKNEIYKREIEGTCDVMLVLDDRDGPVSVWRALGLTCLQVAYGNF